MILSHNGGPPLDDDDYLLNAAGLLIPPDLIDPPHIPINPAFLLGRGLRDYQHAMLLEAARLMRQGFRRILLVAPTGAGKTVIASALMHSAARLGLTSEFIVHRKELIKQTSRSFAERDLQHGFVASGWPFSPDTGITLTGVQTLVNRLALIFPPNLAIVDEAHHAVSETWSRVLNGYPDTFILGLTATPERLDGRGLKEHFDAIVVGPSVAELIRRGFLSPFEFYAPAIPDLSEVGDVAGDFNRGGVDRVMNQPKVIGNVVEHYLSLAPGEQGLLFANSRDHSRAMVEMFKAEGIPAMHVDGSMSQAERDYFDDAFRAGDIRLGSAVDLFGEGYDVPNVSYIGDCAPTKSRSKVKQKWGRPLRLSPGKVRAIICDHAGNAVQQRHGLPDDEYHPTLEGRPKKDVAEKDWTTITQCPECFRVYPSSQAQCPGCHTVAPAQPRIVREETGKLTKLEKEAVRQAAFLKRKKEEWACTSIEEFESLGRARQYDHAIKWAYRQCKMRGISTARKPRT
ncbi:DEAD/DEAH box helicase [Sphingomonas sp. TREG-RG-20F-R18-01]|uniref:DEAD/DEAH box helicase n=1 Tax=Sphingomonas sp. TREG-RG-20F-R18-01 TaxID=2914982 RepID=UPI001F58F4DB|nr:DEAD/DEAH box helicase [Sphingomonas sp. TREG-RG-20F-R18-01]